MEELKTREQIPDKYKWKLSDIIAGDADWEAEYARAEAMLPELEGMKATLVSSADALARGLARLDECGFMVERLFVYSHMWRDEDNGNPAAQAMFDRAMNLNVRLSCAVSYIRPLLAELDSTVLLGYIDECPALANYAFALREIIRGKEHALSEKEERLMAMMGDFSGGAKDIFTMLNNADMSFPTVEHQGRSYPLSHGSYIVLMQSPDRELRRKVYEAYYSSFKQYINTISAAYSTNVKKDVFVARARGYADAREVELFGDNVPGGLYDNLISVIHDNAGEMYRYMDIRKRALGVDELHMFDIYAPLVEEVSAEYSYEQAKALVLEGLSVLGEEYIGILTEAFESGWTDVFETKGKTSGAYSWGVYGTHPYVLLNHRGDLDSVFTIAHEMGHAMHTYYSNATQPYPLSQYTIFVAEVASTVNEILLTKHLLRTTTDKAFRRYVLNHFIDQFRTTVFRQTMFAEFEQLAHGMAERGEPITADTLSALYGDLNALYYGNGVVRDDTICYEWARIPHFYNSFYVYKYATGFSCAVQIAENIDKPGMRDKYLAFLKSGGSDHPLELLKIAGVDLASGEPVRMCMEAFAKALDEFEQA